MENNHAPDDLASVRLPLESLEHENRKPVETGREHDHYSAVGK